MNMTNRLFTRIGTCHSGRPFDLPYNFREDEISEFYSKMSTDERVDIFCLCEAIVLTEIDSNAPMFDSDRTVSSQ
jgi:hypothetical protein